MASIAAMHFDRHANEPGAAQQPRLAALHLRTGSVQQHTARRPEQTEGPARNQGRAGDADRRIHPYEAVELRAKQREDREQPRQRIGKCVQRRGDPIVICSSRY